MLISLSLLRIIITENLPYKNSSIKSWTVINFDINFQLFSTTLYDCFVVSQCNFSVWYIHTYIQYYNTNVLNFAKIPVDIFNESFSSFLFCSKTLRRLMFIVFALFYIHTVRLPCTVLQKPLSVWRHWRYTTIHNSGMPLSFHLLQSKLRILKISVTVNSRKFSYHFYQSWLYRARGTCIIVIISTVTSYRIL